MRSQQVVTLCLFLLACSGCRTHPAVEMLENENRQLEDIIYRQQDLIEDYRRALAARHASAGTPGVIEGPQLTAPELSTSPSSQSAPAGPRSTAPPRPEVTAPPVIEMPTEPSPPGALPEMFRVPDGAQPLDEAPPFVSPGNSSAARTPARGISLHTGNAQVARINLGRIVAWDSGTGSSPVGEGISVVIEPRDAAGRLVEAAAAVSVVALDPSKAGSQARVARWDFSADQIARRLGGSSPSGGIRLDMPWPAALPASSRLHLFVRYTRDDGGKVEADQLVDLSAPEVLGPNWEPAASAAGSRPVRTATAPARPPTPASPRTPTLAPPRRSDWSPERR